MRWHARGGLLAGVTLRRPTRLSEGAPFTNALYVGPPDDDDGDEKGERRDEEIGEDESEEEEEEVRESAAKRAAVAAAGDENAVAVGTATGQLGSQSGSSNSSSGSSRRGAAARATAAAAAQAAAALRPAASALVCSCVVDNGGAPGACVVVDGGASAAFRDCAIVEATTSGVFVPWGRALLSNCTLARHGLCGVTLLDRGAYTHTHTHTHGRVRARLPRLLLCCPGFCVSLPVYCLAFCLFLCSGVHLSLSILLP